jgi:hypothetical protein
MEDAEQLISELRALRQRGDEREASESQHKKVEEMLNEIIEMVDCFNAKWNVRI